MPSFILPILPSASIASQYTSTKPTKVAHDALHNWLSITEGNWNSRVVTRQVQASVEDRKQ